jgi:UDP-N-acetylglucosamine 2-epimerase (non-hydrolysing)
VKRVAAIFGTRPEAIKLAPVLHELAASPHFEPRVLVTAQHRSMLDPMLAFFGLEPDHDLDLLEPGQTLTDVTVRALTGLTELVEREEPDAILVQGDTTTTLAGALAGYYQRIPVAHVEAGLRTGDRYEPFPEEINRRLVSQLATLHLAPTPAAAANLLGEGVAPANVVVTGNTVVDALLWALERPAPESELLREIDGDGRRVVVVTTHRRESWGERMREIAVALAELARADQGLLVVLPIHRNAIVRGAILPALDGVANARVVEPLPYGEFVHLLARSHLIVTDSGGIQEEAPGLGKPVLVTRDTTERPEAIAAGTARLVGTDMAALVAAATELLDDPAAYRAMAQARNPFGDGKAATRIVEAIAASSGAMAAPASRATA